MLTNPAQALDISARRSEVETALAHIRVLFSGMPNDNIAMAKSTVRAAQWHAIDHLTRLALRFFRVAGVHVRVHEALAACVQAMALTCKSPQSQLAPGWIKGPAMAERDLKQRQAEGRHTWRFGNQLSIKAGVPLRST